MRPQPGWRLLVLAASLLPWLLALARTFRLRLAQSLVLCVGLIVLCFYWSATPGSLRNYDVRYFGDGGHLDYVKHVASQLALPLPNSGWEYFQPPLYYIAGALVWRWSQWFDLAEGETLQAFAIVLWLVFLTASAATLRLALNRKPQLLAATTALALWPSGIIHGLRLGNDPAFYAAAAVASWFMIRWWHGGRRSHLIGMSLSIAAALLCKLSAVALIASACILILLRMLRGKHGLEPWIDASIAGAFVAAGVLLALGRNIYFWLRGDISNWLIANIVKLSPSLAVPSHLRQFLAPDIWVFLSSPWIDPFDDATGRANFWNFLLRSSLSGEFHFNGALQRTIAYIWGAILLGLLVTVLAHAATTRWSVRWTWRDAPLFVLASTWLASVLALRITYHFSDESDFRFVLPILVLFLVACARSGKLAQILLATMALSSELFFVTLQ